MFVLKRTDKCPPGCFPYDQTEGIKRHFDATPEIALQAAGVADFRKGNNLPRATKAEAYQDIDCQTCQRLFEVYGAAFTKWCKDTEASAYVAPAIVQPSGGCGGCGARVR